MCKSWTSLSWLVTCLMAGLLVCAGCMSSPSAVSADEGLPDNAANDTYAVLASNVVDAGPDATAAPACVEAGEPATPLHRAMFEALNQYRVENGLAPLIYSRTLEAAADAQARDLWQRAFFAHVNPDGEGPGERAVAAGFCHQYVGENIAAGQATLDRVMAAWKNSPSHNANMLEPDYVYVGVSYSVDANGRPYWAQELAYELP